MLRGLSRCTFVKLQPQYAPGTIRPYSQALPVLQRRAPTPRQTLMPSDVVQWSRLDQITSSLKRSLKEGKNKSPLRNYRKRIESFPAGGRATRFSAYERGIKIFLEHKHFRVAVELHRQMFAEGIFCSSSLRAQILVCESILLSPDEQREESASLFDKLSHVLTLPSYKERDLRDLLQVMQSHPLIDSHFVSRLVDEFVVAKGPDHELTLLTNKRLILFYTQAEIMKLGQDIVPPNGDSKDKTLRSKKPKPYSKLIRELTQRGSLPLTRLDAILKQIAQQQVPADIPLLNAMVQLAVRRQKYHRAFALYKTILTHPAPHMMPDAFVYGSLFYALRSTPAWLNPTNAPSPRRLFRQMLECQVFAIDAPDARTHPVVRVSTLNSALWLFLFSMDYPGAFVVLQTFRSLGLRPDVRTYRTVLFILLAHVKLGLQRRSASQAAWVLQFLGGHDRLLRLSPNDIQDKTVCALLDFALEGGKFRSPPPKLLLRDHHHGEPMWDVEPLERLVAKAMLCAIDPREVDMEQPERTLKEKLAPYFYDMVPDRLWRGRRLRRAAG
ncbi:hypothetical protein BC834DRAFT_865985 [Gloeopeniophorella convolvens]|nr:hypothetical protein BC834DRAFT_865985 [Gloeopeniophorella convolvens]